MEGGGGGKWLQRIPAINPQIEGVTSTNKTQNDTFIFLLRVSL